jgi:metal-responsive CopG/Arc/MetJ family transcriptional regulator
VRVKTSITLPEELLVSIDRVDSNRSSFIEKASRAYLARLEKVRREAADAKIINRNADRLNDEAMDVLEYQGLP